MANRAVITTRGNFNHNGLGIYLHWNGGLDSVKSFLLYCKLQGYRSPDEDSYGWARLCNVISNFFEGSRNVEINTIDNLDCDNYDNGVYLISNWEVVGREYFDGPEQCKYNSLEMLKAINDSMPQGTRLDETTMLNAAIRELEQL
jgi:hypothetical protein